ncbi:MAG TPA: PhzF family phenazine biosynthesis protein [Thermodesulfobacteriota bacterium]
MRRLRFYQVDVFAEAPLEGNPLGVFPDARGLTDDEMQALALELNLSETTFVLPSSNPAAAYRVRIFTPGRELPFAGHPLVGTPWVMAREGAFPLVAPRTEIRHEVQVGVLPVTLETEPDGAGGLRVARVVMTQGRPRLGAAIEGRDADDLAGALGRPAGGVGLPALPPRVVSTGVDQLLVPLASADAVAALTPDLAAVRRIADRCGAAGIFVFALTGDGEARARFFAPSLGMVEDPATGSAAGCLGAYLAAAGQLPGKSLVVRQGVEMRRPSRLDVSVDGETPEAMTVRVAGRVEPVIEGTVTLPG